MNTDNYIYVMTESSEEETTSKMDDIISNDFNYYTTKANPETELKSLPGTLYANPAICKIIKVKQETPNDTIQQNP